MRYAVIIDLDYVSNSYEVCKSIWAAIKNEMLQQGFYLEDRRFVITAPTDEACERARAAVDSVEARFDSLEKPLLAYIKNFYGFRLDCVVNLLVSPVENIQVQEPEE